MSIFVRKNLLNISAQFTPSGWDPDDGTPTQPSSAEVVLNFHNPANQRVTVTIPMTLQSDGLTWLCSWDSSASRGGTVFWTVFAYGGVQAANEGSFVIAANPSNVF